MNYFTEDSIIEPLMKYYKDFDYVTFILDLPFKRGFKLYLKGIENIKEDNEKEIKDHVRQIWLIEIQNGYQGDFESYYKSKIKISENQSLGKSFRDSEEDRILKEIEGKKNIKLKESKVII